MNTEKRDSSGCIAASFQPYHYSIVVMLMLVLLIGCQCSYDNSAYTTARETLDVEIDGLPLPPGSEILDRYDGISMGRVEACRGVYTELLIGNSLPAADVYQFYKDQLIVRGWQVTLEVDRGVVLEKNGRYGIEISDNYYVSTGIPRDTIKSAESQFESLVFINIGYSFYEPEKCQKAIDALGNP